MRSVLTASAASGNQPSSPQAGCTVISGEEGIAYQGLGELTGGQQVPTRFGFSVNEEQWQDEAIRGPLPTPSSPAERIARIPRLPVEHAAG